MRPSIPLPPPVHQITTQILTVWLKRFTYLYKHLYDLEIHMSVKPKQSAT